MAGKQQHSTKQMMSVLCINIYCCKKGGCENFKMAPDITNCEVAPSASAQPPLLTTIALRDWEAPEAVPASS